MVTRIACVLVGMITGCAIGLTFYDWKIAQYGVHLSNQLQLPFEVSIGIRIVFIIILLVTCGIFICCCPREKDLMEEP